MNRAELIDELVKSVRNRLMDWDADEIFEALINTYLYSGRGFRDMPLKELREQLASERAYGLEGAA